MRARSSSNSRQEPGIASGREPHRGAYVMTSSQILAGLVSATFVWFACGFAYLSDHPRPAAGVAWVVTASEKIASRPMLVRANVPYKVAAQ